MAVKRGDTNKINYINLVMKDIGTLTDSIYESMMDEDQKTLPSSISSLQELLRNL